MPIGPSRPLNLAKPEFIDIRQAARYFGARGEADSATLTLLEKCAAPLLAAATPRAVWLEADVESLTQAGILKGEDIFRHLEGCSEALLLAVTVGPRRGRTDTPGRCGRHRRRCGVGRHRLCAGRTGCGRRRGELRQWAAEQDKYLTGRFSPGYGDWPIGVQPLVAAALDTARRAGLCVTENDLMTPRKSVTALLGLSDHPVKGRLAGCGHCVLNTRCEYRKRGKTCASE